MALEPTSGDRRVLLRVAEGVHRLLRGRGEQVAWSQVAVHAERVHAEGAVVGAAHEAARLLDEGEAAHPIVMNAAHEARLEAGRDELVQVVHLEIPILVGDGEAAGPVLAHVGLLDQAQRGRHGRQPPRALRAQRRHVHHQQARVRRHDGQPAVRRAVDRRMRPALLGEGEGLRVLQPPA